MASHIMHDYTQADLDAKTRGMLDFAVKLTTEPWAMKKADVNALRDLGLTDEEVLSVVLITCNFNFMSRLANGLGRRAGRGPAGAGCGVAEPGGVGAGVADDGEGGVGGGGRPFTPNLAAMGDHTFRAYVVMPSARFSTRAAPCTTRRNGAATGSRRDLWRNCTGV